MIRSLAMGRLVRQPAFWLFGAALALYLPALGVERLSWDSAELALGVYTQGIVHATGYPLYLITARLFTLLLPGLELLTALSLYSALLGATTTALIGLLIGDLLRDSPHRLTGTGCALLFPLVPAVWAQGVTAEVYMLHTALIAACLIAVRRWETTHRWLWLKLVFGCLALGLANHLAALLVALIVLPYLAMRGAGLRRIALYSLVMALGVGGLYLYLPVRLGAEPAFNLVATYFTRDLRRLPDLLWMVRGDMFGRMMFAYPLDAWIGEWFRFLDQLWSGLWGFGFVLGLAGIAGGWRSGFTGLLIALFAAQAAFFSGYSAFDKADMFHTAYLAWIVLAGLGWDTLMRRLATPYRTAASAILGITLLAGTLNAWNAANAPDSGLAEARDLMMELPADAVLIGPWTTLRPLEYFQIVHGQRTDLRLVDTTLIGLGLWDRHTAETVGAAAQTYYAELLKTALQGESPRPVFAVEIGSFPVDDLTIIPRGPYLYQIEAEGQ